MQNEIRLFFSCHCHTRKSWADWLKYVLNRSNIFTFNRTGLRSLRRRRSTPQCGRTSFLNSGKTWKIMEVNFDPVFHLFAQTGHRHFHLTELPYIPLSPQTGPLQVLESRLLQLKTGGKLCFQTNQILTVVRFLLLDANSFDMEGLWVCGIQKLNLLLHYHNK